MLMQLIMVALHAAAFLGKLKNIKVLLEAGEDAKSETIDGKFTL